MEIRKLYLPFICFPRRDNRWKVWCTEKRLMIATKLPLRVLRVTLALFVIF